MDESVKRLPKKMPRACWPKDHAAEVVKLKAKGMSTKEIASHLGKSNTTIRAALTYATEVADPGAETAEVHGSKKTSTG